jgi:hypothetical protein
LRLNGLQPCVSAWNIASRLTGEPTTTVDSSQANSSWRVQTTRFDFLRPSSRIKPGLLSVIYPLEDLSSLFRDLVPAEEGDRVGLLERGAGMQLPGEHNALFTHNNRSRFVVNFPAAAGPPMVRKCIHRAFRINPCSPVSARIRKAPARSRQREAPAENVRDIPHLHGVGRKHVRSKNGSACMTSRTKAAKPSAPLRKSTAFVATVTRTAPVGPITWPPSARR